MTKPHLGRRALLGAAMAATLPFLNPSRDERGRLHLVRPADAAWLQVASLAISAISAFSKSGDNGLGAYLGNIKKLSEENIRLSRDILVRVADVQAQIKELPERLRTVFIEVSGYRFAQQTQTALNYVLEVEASGETGGKLSKSNRQKCEEVLRICADMAGARAAPYGLGGTAASCLPMITAVDARSHYFLNRLQDYRNRVRISYIPWIDAILADRDFSLQRTLLTEGAHLAEMSRTSLAGLPAAQRSAMESQWQAIVSAEPGSTSADFVLACGSYGRQTGTRDGRRCVETYCEPRHTVHASPIKRILDAARLDAAELAALPAEALPAPPGSSATLSSPRDLLRTSDCYCTRREQIPVYSPDRDSQLVGRLRTILNQDGTSAVNLERSWTQRSPAQCGVAINGTEGTAAAQAQAVQAHFKTLADSMDSFEKNELLAYNEQRALVFTTFKLLESTRATRSALVRASA